MEEKERENTARIETVKSQAIFAVSCPRATTRNEVATDDSQTHAAFNSTIKLKDRGLPAQRPVTPTKTQTGSPKRRPGKSLITAAPKGSTKSPNLQHRATEQPRFGNLNNGFSATVRVRRPSLDRPQSPSGDPADPLKDLVAENYDHQDREDLFRPVRQYFDSTSSTTSPISVST